MTFAFFLKRALPALTLAALSFSAAAHVGDAHDHGGFLTGFLHPITGLDHLAAMLAVGVWSAMTTKRLWIAPASFAALLLAGALMAQAGVAFPAIEPMIAASGSFTCAAHGQELADGAALAGMVLGTAVLHAVGIAMGLGLKRAHHWLPRVAGGAVALMGLNMGWSLLAG
jgi:urease accessory protein